MGVELDRAVALADGWTRDSEDRSAWLKNGRYTSISAAGIKGGFGFSPSTNWADGGPIIERERISITLNNKGTWTAWPTPSDPSNQMEGPTPLIAAMRAFVASKSTT